MTCLLLAGEAHVRGWGPPASTSAAGSATPARPFPRRPGRRAAGAAQHPTVLQQPARLCAHPRVLRSEDGVGQQSLGLVQQPQERRPGRGCRGAGAPLRALQRSVRAMPVPGRRPGPEAQHLSGPPQRPCGSTAFGPAGVTQGAQHRHTGGDRGARGRQQGPYDDVLGPRRHLGRGGEREQEHPRARRADVGPVAAPLGDGRDHRHGQDPPAMRQEQAAETAQGDRADEPGPHPGQCPGAEPVRPVVAVEPGERTERGEHRRSGMAADDQGQQRQAHRQRGADRGGQTAVTGLHREHDRPPGWRPGGAPTAEPHSRTVGPRGARPVERGRPAQCRTERPIRQARSASRRPSATCGSSMSWSSSSAMRPSRW